MTIIIDNNIMKASDLEVSAVGIIPEIAVVKNVRISYVLDAEGKKTDKVETVRYDCVNPDNFSMFTLKVEATRPVVTKEILEASEEPIYIAIPIRTVPMLKDVRKALLQEKKKRMAEGFNDTEIDGYTGFIFTNKVGYIHNPQTINRAIKRIIRDHNNEEKEIAKQEKREPVLIRDFSVHSLRHTFCNSQFIIV